VLPEAIVIFACINSTGCSETSNLYFQQNPDIKRQVDKDAENIREYIGPRVVDNFGPILFIFAGGTGTIHIHDHIDLRINKTSGIFSFNWVF
jgi:hypothetical protein